VSTASAKRGHRHSGPGCLRGTGRALGKARPYRPAGGSGRDLLVGAADRRYFTGMLHQVILTALAATAGIMAALMLGLHGGPSITRTVTLYAFFGCSCS
jgi:hypothetical protein